MEEGSKVRGVHQSSILRVTQGGRVSFGLRKMTVSERLASIEVRALRDLGRQHQTMPTLYSFVQKISARSIASSFLSILTACGIGMSRTE